MLNGPRLAGRDIGTCVTRTTVHPQRPIRPQDSFDLPEHGHQPRQPVVERRFEADLVVDATGAALATGVAKPFVIGFAEHFTPGRITNRLRPASLKLAYWWRYMVAIRLPAFPAPGAVVPQAPVNKAAK